MKELLHVDLSFMPIHDILQWIDMNHLSCVVMITLEHDQPMTVYLENGRIIFASSPKKGSRLGETLVRAGVLSEVQALHALAESRNRGVLFSRYLIDNGLVSSAALADVLTNMVLRILVEVISSKNGSVSVTAPLPVTALDAPIRLDTGRAVFDAVRIFDELHKNTEQRDAAINEINRRLYREEFQLPVLPGILTQMFSIMEDPKATFQDMAKLIMTDQVLISRILKVANSVFYAASGEVDSIHYAIIRLGMREIMNIVTGIQINSLQNKDIPQDQLQAILDDALKTAFVASGLARHCHQDPEEAFLGGLLLDLGKTVILSLAKDFQISRSFLDDLSTTQHAEIGALIAKKWNYPESIQNLIRYHHKQNFGGMVNNMITLLQIADQVVQNGLENEPCLELLQTLDLSPEAITEVYPRAMETFNQIKAL